MPEDTTAFPAFAVCSLGVQFHVPARCPESASLKELGDLPSPFVNIRRPVRDDNKLDAQKFRTLFNTIYEFRKGFLDQLAPTEISMVVQVLGLPLTAHEKERYLNPGKVIAQYFPLLQKYMSDGWGITMIGRGMTDILHCLVNPVAAFNRICPSGGIKGLSTTVKLGNCSIISGAPRSEHKRMYPLQRPPKRWTNLSIEAELCLREGGSGWSCSDFAIQVDFETSITGQKHRQAFPFYYIGNGLASEMVGLYVAHVAWELPLDYFETEDMKSAIATEWASIAEYVHLHVAPAEMKVRAMSNNDPHHAIPKIFSPRLVSEESKDEKETHNEDVDSKEIDSFRSSEPPPRKRKRSDTGC